MWKSQSEISCVSKEKTHSGNQFLLGNLFTRQDKKIIPAALKFMCHSHMQCYSSRKTATRQIKLQLYRTLKISIVINDAFAFRHTQFFHIFFLIDLLKFFIIYLPIFYLQHVIKIK